MGAVKNFATTPHDAIWDIRNTKRAKVQNVEQVVELKIL